MTAENGVIRLRRTIFAPPGRVYRAWLEPSLVGRWLAPPGIEVVRVEIDERAGGHYRAWEAGRGIDAGGLDCRLIELVPDARIVLRWRWVGPELMFDPTLDSRLTISLREASGGATRLTIVDERPDASGRPARMRSEGAGQAARARREELDEIWRRYERSGDRALRDRLILTYAPLVKYVAGKLGSWLPPHVEQADLMSCGLLGLVGAIERFEPDGKITFESFAIARIRRAMIDELRSLDWVPRGVRSRAEEIARAMAELRSRNGRPASDEQLAGELGITLGELEERLAQIARSSVVALHELWSGGGSTALIDTIEDTHGSARGHELMRLELRRGMADAIARLPDAERLVLTLHYYEGLTLREIGEVLSVSESRVSRLHTKAILRLNAVDWLPGEALWDGGPPPHARAADPDRGWREALNRLAATLADAA